MILKAKNEYAFADACALPFAQPLGDLRVDVDDHHVSVLDMKQYHQESAFETYYADRGYSGLAALAH